MIKLKMSSVADRGMDGNFHSTKWSDCTDYTPGVRIKQGLYSFFLFFPFTCLFLCVYVCVRARVCVCV